MTDINFFTIYQIIYEWFLTIFTELSPSLGTDVLCICPELSVASFSLKYNTIEILLNSKKNFHTKHLFFFSH